MSESERDSICERDICMDSLLQPVPHLLSGNIGNVMVIGAVLVDRRLRKSGNLFILNLAVADLCVTGEEGANTLCRHIFGEICEFELFHKKWLYSWLPQPFNRANKGIIFNPCITIQTDKILRCNIYRDLMIRHKITNNTNIPVRLGWLICHLY